MNTRLCSCVQTVSITHSLSHLLAHQRTRVYLEATDPLVMFTVRYLCVYVQGAQFHQLMDVPILFISLVCRHVASNIAVVSNQCRFSFKLGFAISCPTSSDLDKMWQTFLQVYLDMSSLHILQSVTKIDK